VSLLMRIITEELPLGKAIHDCLVRGKQEASRVFFIFYIIYTYIIFILLNIKINLSLLFRR
jgi:hypothetical protein